jgi:hypothetical protein
MRTGNWAGMNYTDEVRLAIRVTSLSTGLTWSSPQVGIVEPGAGTA